MYEKYLAERIAKLRTLRNVSARDMSLSIGQNENYINHIENGKSMPSTQVFFYICEYFKISPKDFFDDDLGTPAQIQAGIDDLNALSDNQVASIHEIIKGLKK